MSNVRRLMDQLRGIELTGIDRHEHRVLFTATASAQQTSHSALLVELEELAAFQAAFASRPFGSTKPHRFLLQYLKQAGSFICGLRVRSEGSRVDVEVPVSSNTFMGLEYIFNQFALDPELVPERPASVLQADA